MWELSKRRFLQAAGLAIAGRILPRRLLARPPEPRSGSRKVIIVTFGGGVRYSETFAPEGLRNIPRLKELRAQGFFYRTCANAGVLSHFNSTASILTGDWQRVDDFGFERPAGATIFEYYRKQTGSKATDAWAICTNKSFSPIGAASLRDWGVPYGAQVVLPKQLLIEAVDEVVKKNRDGGAANRENVLRQLEEILNEGYEGLGWTIFKAGRDLDQTVRATLTRSLVEYINGPEMPSSGDELTFFIAREVMREFAPPLMLVNFWDMDVAHWGAYSLYLQAITRTDRLVGMLWEEILANPNYKDKTTLLVLPELGRDGDVNTANGFLNHRSGDASCRNMWLLALGAGVPGGESERPVAHIDVCATAAAVLGVKTAAIAGRPMREIAGA
ncbi:MAG: hypothetical protein HYZ57_01575 [Acidobacteria bacterium]|nr:hypothetical protein [Acidobacteriota bacterium]MBI3278513.1 hypothetical protein [Acidobacteriota bacterium]